MKPTLDKKVVHYKLKEPVKVPFSERIPRYFLMAILVILLLWIMLIHPLSLPADKMPFIFVKDPIHNPHSQRFQYFIATFGAFILAGLLSIPTIINDIRFNYFMAKLWVNRDYISNTQYNSLCDKANYRVFLPNNIPECKKDLQSFVDIHQGKDLRVQKYNMRKEYAEDLQAIEC